MGLIFRKRVPVKRDGPLRTWLNLSRSGVSSSVRLGRVTANSRRGITIRLGKGFSWRL